MYTIPVLIYLADHIETRPGPLETLDLSIRRVVKEWLHLPPSTWDAILYSRSKDSGLALIKLVALIPSMQAQRFHKLVQSSDEALVSFLKREHLEVVYEKLWLRAGGVKESILLIWEPIPVRETIIEGEFETSAHVIGNCPVTRDVRIKRHNSICEILSHEAKRENWTVYQEPHLRDEKNELYKPDLIFVKGNKAFVVDVTVRYKNNNSSLKEAAAEKAKKYQGLLPQIKELTNTDAVEFVGSP
ncbi:hypothetical protein HGM15179_012939 [Zosterops borbonicus]|uniref:Uncharacterized protein n=1 Tax=Zosterops borbonicus TaxID=364589 RepID=A0A8K1G9V8_9PASS|nr:hypothetical protein HGM15179_012939 [Zosterops borbonicus]